MASKRPKISIGRIFIWRLAIAHTDFYYVIVCSYLVFGCLFRSPHVVRLKCKDQVEVMEDFQLEVVFEAITDSWTPFLGEVLQCKIESSNIQDRYAVVVQCKHTVVGHVPSKYRQLARYSSKKPEESTVQLLKLGVFQWTYLKED